MPKTIQDITIKDVQKLFDDEIYLRGERYFESGHIIEIEPEDTSTITGTVEGSNDYSVTIEMDSEGDISCECSCPCDFNCKHAAALLLEWVSIKGEYNKELKAVYKEPIKDILNEKSKEELIELLIEFLSKHPDMKPLVRIEKKEVVSKVKMLFSKFWEWNEVIVLISQLEIILEGIKKDKQSWDKELLNEMKMCNKIMAEGQNEVHDEGDLGLFLEDWFLLYGEIFASLKPSPQEKQDFLQEVIELIKKDDYGLEGSFEKAILGMCKSKDDVKLIIENYKPSKSEDENYYDSEEEDYKRLYLELYNKVGMDDEYLNFARDSGYNLDVIEKLISLKKYKEALQECEKAKGEDDFWAIGNKKIEILQKLGKKQELKKLLFELSIKSGDIEYVLQLKKEAEAKEWKEYFKKLVSDSNHKNRNSLLSKIYFHEQDYKTAFEYSKGMTSMGYLEMLARKLGDNYPLLACEIYRKLCFKLIDSGSGEPYKQAGEMLKAIKKLDKKGMLFIKIKEEITSIHKKKYSLMEIIGRV